MPKLDERTPRVTIITPVYNAERFIGRCIQSALDQTFTDWEQVIVDDGSTDRTEDIARSFTDPRIKYVRMPHRGLEALAESYNIALSQSSGDLIGVLEGDDVWLPNKLELQVRAFDDPDVVLSWGEAIVINAENERQRHWRLPRAGRRTQSTGELFRALARGNFLSALTVMTRRTVLERLGGFQQTGSRMYVDYPTWLLICATSRGKCVYIADDIAEFRIYSHNTGTIQNSRMRIESAQVVREVIDNLGEERLRDLGWSRRDDRRVRTSGSLTRGIAHIQDRKLGDARAEFAQALKQGVTPRDYAIALTGYASAATGINMIGALQRARIALAGLKLKALPMVVLAMFLAACSKDSPTDPLANAHLQVVSGDQQSAGAASQLPQPVSVKLVDGAGNPMRGVAIDWVVLEGGGSTDSVRTTTDAQGVAVVHWQLGSTPGSQTLLASTRTASIAIHAKGLLKFTSVAAGFHHTCAIATTGEAYCWGDNSKGQLGIDAAASTKPVAVNGRLKFAQLAAGWFHTCGISDGDVYCWGENVVGALGSPGGNAIFPRKVASSEKFTVITAGYHHSCGISTSGVAYCWGEDGARQLGVGETAPACATPGVAKCSDTPLKVSSPKTFKDIAAGEFHTCAVDTDGVLYCWGSNSNGQLGTNSPANAMLNVPTAAITPRRYKNVGVGSRHGCAIATDGIPDCWGRNAAGENGIVAGVALLAPNRVTTTLQFTKIDGGDETSCGLTASGAYCWGRELGNGSVAGSTVPTAVSLVSPVSDISAGYQHVCAVAANDVYCWGSNSNGQLGISGSARSNTPVKVAAE